MHRLSSSLVLSVFLAAAPAAYAANGANLLGVSPASTAMGGTGVANYTNETDAMYKNPALLGASGAAQSGDAELSANFFKNSPTATAVGTTASSQAGTKVMPNIVGSYRMMDNKLALGLGYMTYGGGVVDYTGVQQLGEIKTQNSFGRLEAGASYKINDVVSVGIAPFLILGNFVVNDNLAFTGQTNRSADNRSALAGQIGVALNWSKFSVAGTFISKSSDLKFQQIVNLRNIGEPGTNPAALSDITVNQPAEAALGIAFRPSDNFKVTFDYRYIAWSKTSGYGENDLGWSDQHVLAVGGQYSMDKLALRMGFNYGASPIKNIAGENGEEKYSFQGTNIYRWGQTLLNLVAFPGVAQANLTLGAGYQITDALFADLGFQYSFSSQITHTGTSTTFGNKFQGGNPNYSFAVDSKQWSLAAGVGYRF